MSSNNAVIHDPLNDTLRCAFCHYERPIPPWATRNPDKYLDFASEFAAEHKECAEYANDPHLAEINFRAKLAQLRKKQLRYKPVQAAA
jgi:hypothetical protein